MKINMRQPETDRQHVLLLEIKVNAIAEMLIKKGVCTFEELEKVFMQMQVDYHKDNKKFWEEKVS